jgi:hypothetical protein
VFGQSEPFPAYELSALYHTHEDFFIGDNKRSTRPSLVPFFLQMRSDSMQSSANEIRRPADLTTTQ